MYTGSMRHQVLRQTGFTIVELLIVIVIIAILAAISIIAYNGVQDRARDSQNDARSNNWRSFLETYAALNDETLPTQANLTNGSWQQTNSLKSAMLKDAQGNDIVSTAGGDPSTGHLNVYIPQVGSDAPCAAIVQVYHQADSTTSTYIIDKCSGGWGFSTPTGGNACPATFTNYWGGTTLTEDPTTHFCYEQSIGIG